MEGATVSTHEYRVKKRHMCQALGLRADKTTMAELKAEWAKRGYTEWPDTEQDIKRIMGGSR